MPSCHTRPFIQTGVLIERVPATSAAQPKENAPAESCDYCGSRRLEWRKCKLMCADCRHIIKSCADL